MDNISQLQLLVLAVIATMKPQQVKIAGKSIHKVYISMKVYPAESDTKYHSKVYSQIRTELLQN